jgi:hypothetical protein
MRTSRRFQPIVDGLPYRIAPSSVASVAPVASAPAPIMTAFDTDMPQSGTSTNPIILVGPPTSGAGGGLAC